MHVLVVCVAVNAFMIDFHMQNVKVTFHSYRPDITFSSFFVSISCMMYDVDMSDIT